MTEPKKQKRTVKAAKVIHGVAPDGRLVVQINDLRVILVSDGPSWFAQGLEIDYASQGNDIDDVQDKFAKGLICTVAEHLRIYNSIEKLLKPAPPEVWKELFYTEGMKGKRFSVVGLFEFEKKQKQDFPFENIAFLRKQEPELVEA